MVVLSQHRESIGERIAAVICNPASSISLAGEWHVHTYPICSMYGIFTHISPKNHPNVGKYTIHGAYGYVLLHFSLHGACVSLRFPKFSYQEVVVACNLAHTPLWLIWANEPTENDKSHAHPKQRPCWLRSMSATCFLVEISWYLAWMIMQ